MSTGNLEKTPNETELTRCTACYRPNVDIVERQDELILVADMPGVAHDGIEIDFENGELKIHGRVPNRYPESRPILNEFGIGDFYRSFRVSEGVNAQQIHAEYNNGVLAVHLPKVEAVKPRKIAVKVG